MQGLALHNPHHSKDRIGKQKEDNCPLQGSQKYFAIGNPHQEEAYRDFCPHERCECLNPFSICVFPELLQMMRAKILLALAEAIVYLNEIKTSTYGCPKLPICKQVGSWSEGTLYIQQLE